MRIYLLIFMSSSEWSDYFEAKLYFDVLKNMFSGLAENAAYLRRHSQLVSNMAKWASRPVPRTVRSRLTLLSFRCIRSHARHAVTT